MANSKEMKITEGPAKAIQELVAEHPFLRGMSPKHLDTLASCAMEMSFKEGELIFREGDIANRFYIIETGGVVLEADADHRGRVVIQTIGGGDVLGWSWLFPPYYWRFDARAVEPTKAIFFYGTRLREYCEEDPSLGYELMKRMAEVVIKRLQATRRKLLSISNLDQFAQA